MEQEIREQLKQLRLQSGYSLRKASKLSGFSYQHINKMETGEISPTIASVEKLIEIYGKKLVIVDK